MIKYSDLKTHQVIAHVEIYNHLPIEHKNNSIISKCKFEMDSNNYKICNVELQRVVIPTEPNLFIYYSILQDPYIIGENNIYLQTNCSGDNQFAMLSGNDYGHLPLDIVNYISSKYNKYLVKKYGNFTASLYCGTLSPYCIVDQDKYVAGILIDPLR